MTVLTLHLASTIVTMAMTWELFVMVSPPAHIRIQTARSHCYIYTGIITTVTVQMYIYMFNNVTILYYVL